MGESAAIIMCVLSWTWALMQVFASVDQRQWDAIEDTPWKMEMREKYPWPQFRL